MTDATRSSAAAARAMAMRSELFGQPCDTDAPVFQAPWEAQAFAMTLALHERGLFTWKEWAQTLSEVIGEARQRGDADTGEHYYHHWQTALERIVAGKGLVTSALLRQRREQWDEAARRTPHGQPIQLRA
jgi:nitrile hydratase accessory protein